MTTRVSFPLISADALASLAEAQAGTASNKLMTPERVAQAISQQVQPFSWGDHVDFYTTGRTSPEQYTSLPINGDARAILSVGPIPVTTKDLIVAMGEFEVSSEDDTFNIGVWSRIIVGSSNVDITPIAEMTESNGRNVTPNMHHDTHAKVAMLRSPINSGVGIYVNLLANAASSSGVGPLVVELDYGHLDVLILKNFFP